VRINVIGTSGSGKTTFGRKLAKVIDHPFIEMDAVYWGPNWSMPPDKEFFQLLRKILLAEDWVLDGNYTRTLDFKWDRVQAVVWLHFSFPRTVYQAIKRALTRLFDQEELWPGTGNRENVRMLFSRQSIVWYTISNYYRHTKRNSGYLEDERYNHIKFHHIRSPRQAELFLDKVGQDPNILINEY
jgi:adenylate kinase family enzyme